VKKSRSRSRSKNRSRSRGSVHSRSRRSDEQGTSASVRAALFLARKNEEKQEHEKKQE
jgi:hypothetical protein